MALWITVDGEERLRGRRGSDRMRSRADENCPEVYQGRCNDHVAEC